jgi:hypothetical protein
MLGPDICPAAHRVGKIVVAVSIGSGLRVAIRIRAAQFVRSMYAAAFGCSMNSTTSLVPNLVGQLSQPA